jgi:hypothetical protein
MICRKPLSIAVATVQQRFSYVRGHAVGEGTLSSFAHQLTDAMEKLALLDV